jgi:hypothetical protein
MKDMLKLVFGTLETRVQGTDHRVLDKICRVAPAEPGSSNKQRGKMGTRTRAARRATKAAQRPTRRLENHSYRRLRKASALE